MKSVYVFLASSINEFAAWRHAIGAMIQSMNSKLVDEDVYINLVICEFLSTAIAESRKQDEYNDQIRESDLFIMLIGKTVGGYTLEEFNVAVEAKNGTGKPRILILFNSDSDDEADETVDALKQTIATEELESSGFSGREMLLAEVKQAIERTLCLR